MKWVDMRKGAYLFRYRVISLLTNSRYLADLVKVEEMCAFLYSRTLSG